MPRLLTALMLFPPCASERFAALATAECVKLMHNRFFGGRQLSCIYWDGVTDFTVAEAESALEAREEAFGDWLDDQDLPDDLKVQIEGN